MGRERKRERTMGEERENNEREREKIGAKSNSEFTAMGSKWILKWQ